MVLLAFCLTLVSWGSKGHYVINNKCPQSFPVSMNAFRVWADSLDLHGSDADTRKSDDPTESPKHFIDIDNYTEFTSKGRIASTYDSVVVIHGSSFVVKNGILPWATLNTYDSLKQAFKQRKWHKAMLIASDLGHYVGDGHMPLHLSANYDGQKTGQSGIHSRYESDMVYAYLSSLSNYSGSSVQFVSNVNKYVFTYIYTNQHYVDSVLLADTYAVNLDATYSTPYYSALWSKTHFTITLFKNASHALAELIYSAWVEAGSPAFGSTTALSNVNERNISVYPNPASDRIYLVGDYFLKTQICTIDGKLVGTFYGNQIDVSHFFNGIYILNLFGKNGWQKKEKVLVAK